MPTILYAGEDDGAAHAARCSFVTDDRQRRGAAILRRRTALGVFSVTDFARRTGKNRDTISAAESGRASDATYAELETWLDSQEGNGRALVEFEALGAGWRVVLRGPIEEADSLREQVVRLIREIGAENAETGPQSED